MDSLSIVIPAYNEEKRLPLTLETVLRYLDRQTFSFVEILVVDDGSRDGTAVLVERVAARDPRLRLLRNPGNRGKGYSVRHGTLEGQGEYILFTDADLSSPIEELAKLRDAVEREKAAVAIGSRALDRSLVGVHQPFFREASGRFFNLAMRLVTGLPFRDTQCGFKLFQREAAREIFARQTLDGFGFDVEALYLAQLLGYRVVEVPVRWNDVEGTKVSLLHGLKAFLDPLRVRWNHLSGRYGRT
ncbi:MAG: dolichyl-phosphate beta-glucosyltransferase [Bryobacteraceae bacterium]